MKKILTGALAAITLAGSLGAAGAASADGYHGGYGGYGGYGYHHGGGGAGLAIGAGILGLAVGAAIANDHPRYYAPAPVYYAPAPVYRAPVYYDDEYAYAAPVCRGAWRWDPYEGRYFRVRNCY